MGQTVFIKDGEFKGSMEYDPECSHKNSRSTGKTCFEGCCDYYKCDDCGKEFLVECPD